jgi:triosephosphate isomerase
MRFVANFKTNHTRATTSEYLKTLNPILQELNCTDTLIFPPATALQDGTSHIKVGAQNAYYTTNGAFTGELGLEQLAEFGIETILIGHSERREILGESQEFIAKKFEFFANEGFEIIYCIGEPLEIREQGANALFDYLFAQFEGIDTNYNKLTVAYEPIWAIGTGVSATIDDIELVHNKLKEKLSLPLLYGGSVKVANIAEIAKIESVDGVLVGSASLDANEFAKLIKEGLGA